MRLYVGVDVSLSTRPELAGIPRCVSHHRLTTRRTIQPANGPTFIDSGAFTMLKDHGRWTITADEYITDIRRIVSALGPDNVVGVAAMDYMCEDIVIEGGDTKDGRFVGTRQHLGLTAGASLDDCVREHQRLTIANYLELVRLAPDLHIVPAVQGNSLSQYLRCVAMYRAAGVDLTTLPLVGLGSVCRRQATDEIDLIVTTLHAMGINLHGYGVKQQGVEAYGGLLTSADSQAWSYAARKRVGLCPHGVVKHEANCPVAAATWWRRVSGGVGDVQPALDLFGAVAA
jgi:hypothetical protein